jgi:hypothetical protein
MFVNIPLLPIGFAFLGNRVLVNDFSYRKGEDYLTILYELLIQSVVHRFRLPGALLQEEDTSEQLDKKACRRVDLVNGFTPVSRDKIFPANLFKYLKWRDDPDHPLSEKIEFKEWDYLKLINEQRPIPREANLFNYIFIDPPFGVETQRLNVTPAQGLQLTKFSLTEAHRLLKSGECVCLTLPPLGSERFYPLRNLNWGNEVRTHIENVGFHLTQPLVFPNILERVQRAYIVLRK